MTKTARRLCVFGDAHSCRTSAWLTLATVAMHGVGSPARLPPSTDDDLDYAYIEDLPKEETPVGLQPQASTLAGSSGRQLRPFSSLEDRLCRMGGTLSEAVGKAGDDNDDYDFTASFATASDLKPGSYETLKRPSARAPPVPSKPPRLTTSVRGFTPLPPTREESESVEGPSTTNCNAPSVKTSKELYKSNSVAAHRSRYEQMFPLTPAPLTPIFEGRKAYTLGRQIKVKPSLQKSPAPQMIATQLKFFPKAIDTTDRDYDDVAPEEGKEPYRSASQVGLKLLASRRSTAPKLPVASPTAAATGEEKAPPLPKYPPSLIRRRTMAPSMADRALPALPRASDQAMQATTERHDAWVPGGLKGRLKSAYDGDVDTVQAGPSIKWKVDAPHGGHDWLEVVWAGLPRNIVCERLHEDDDRTHCPRCRLELLTELAQLENSLDIDASPSTRELLGRFPPISQFKTKSDLMTSITEICYYPPLCRFDNLLIHMFDAKEKRVTYLFTRNGGRLDRPVREARVGFVALYPRSRDVGYKGCYLHKQGPLRLETLMTVKGWLEEPETLGCFLREAEKKYRSKSRIINVLEYHTVDGYKQSLAPAYASVSESPSYSLRSGQLSRAPQ